MMLFFKEISSLHAEQNNFPLLTCKNSPGNSLTRSSGLIFFRSHWLVEALFLAGGFLTLFRAKWDLAAGFSTLKRVLGTTELAEGPLTATGSSMGSQTGSSTIHSWSESDSHRLITI